MKLRKAAVYFIALLSLLTSNVVLSHAFDPSLLIINKVSSGELELYWRKPDLNGTPLPLEVELPTSCKTTTKVTSQLEAAVWVSQWNVLCKPSSFNEPLIISGLDRYDVNVIVRFKPNIDEDFHTYLIKSDNPSVILEADTSFYSIFTTYTFLGFEHILEGWDHLLFLFALILLIRNGRKLIIAITAFTLAHSITLFASVINIINLNPKFVEAMIAFSIVFLAYELAKSTPNTTSLTKRYPWLVTFTFGLLHGFGFAGALREIGIPQGEIPVTLLAFNIGVELGQLLFLAVVFVAFSLICRMFKDVPRLNSDATKLSAYLIGTASSFWLLERIWL